MLKCLTENQFLGHIRVGFASVNSFSFRTFYTFLFNLFLIYSSFIYYNLTVTSSPSTSSDSPPQNSVFPRPTLPFSLENRRYPRDIRQTWNVKLK